MQDSLILPARLRSALLPRYIAATLLGFLLCASGGTAHAAPVPQFGSPPTGQIPILYNDHTVYTKPDILRRSRVLAAIYKNGNIYIPLRSMFEQMGATVSVSHDGKTVTATRDSRVISVTVGAHQFIIDGQARPLDVPPMLYKGVVLVPVRVISEALGAYVLWLPNRRLVVVRYIPATPLPTEAPPTPMPTEAPTASPTPMPTAVPTPPILGYVEGAFFAAKNYNEFSAGQYCPRSYMISGAYMFAHSPFSLNVDYRSYSYVTSDNLSVGTNHYTQFATIDGGTALMPVMLAKQSSLDARVEYEVAAPRINIGVGYIHTTTNYGYPSLNAIGVGVEKLPDLRPGVKVFGSLFYYPSAHGDYTVTGATSPNVGITYRQKYDITKFDIGLSLVLKHSPVYLYGGFAGDQYAAKQNAPISQTHNGPYLGLGVKF